MPSIHIYYENNGMVSEHIWNPNIDIDSLVDWWHNMTEGFFDVTKLNGRITEVKNQDPDPRWCLFVSDGEMYFSLGDKYFERECSAGIV